MMEMQQALFFIWFSRPFHPMFSLTSKIYYFVYDELQKPSDVNILLTKVNENLDLENTYRVLQYLEVTKQERSLVK